DSSVDLPQPSFPSVGDSLLLQGPGTAWPVHGGNVYNQRHSSLDQIDRTSVASLVPVWFHATGLEGAFGTTPVVVDNTLYLT
ncbi:MAG: hypothetical protein GWO27_17935, partial [Thermoplasmata archaeon]|nr:hypothetical protein [Thermoplasmata archaeon]NIT79274.1 hypothetical protein [Thermoplasmata archaeon]NIY05642.1 hypothetical protein [Thermoplasmata archaeon]